MQPITFTSTCYQAGDQPIYLLSGEFHYFRVPKKDWRKRMQLFKEAGGNCLATYVPWLLHEPVEGNFQFSGEDWLDLEGFLKTAQEENLYVVARPGPYQYSELVYHGLPGWLIQNYPDILARTADGKVIGYASVSYTHPLFLEKVKNWFAAVCPILARYTIQNGGPIAFTQIDNEMVGIHEWFGSLDYHPTSMGMGRPDGAYSQFLQKRYGSLIDLNLSYGTDYSAFEQVPPVPTPAQDPVAKIRQKKDYFDFYLSTVSDYAQTLTGMLRTNGIQTPVMHNSGNPGMNAYFTETAEQLGKAFMLGSDHYYNLDQTWPQNNPTPQYAARVFISLEMLRLMGYPPSVLELPGGSASDWPPMTPGDALAAYMTNLAFGMKGSNYYIFTGGPNPPGAGNTTDLYDYGASIGALGEIRPLFEAQKTFGKFVGDHPEWLKAKRVHDFRIGMDLEYARSEQYWNERGPFVVTNPEAWQFMRRGVLTTALCAGLSPEFVNLATDDWASDTNTPLVIASSVSMAADKQRRIVEYLSRGGRAVICPVLPSLDEHLQPCTMLSDFLGRVQQNPNPAGLARPQIGGVVNVNGTTFPLENLPDQARVFGTDEFSGKPVAVSINLPGNGQVVVLGLSWTHAMREHERMLVKVLSELGLDQAVQCSNPNLWTTVYLSDHKATLFVLNLFTTPMQAEIRFKGHDQGIWIDAGTVSIDPISVRAFDFDL